MTETARPTLAIGLANYGSTFGPGEWHRFTDLGRAAEDAGIDRVIVVDHVVMGPHTENYVWGKFPVPSDAPWFEPLTVLAAIAAVTTTIRLSTGILIAPLRPAALLAKQVATLDQLSQGRVDLGVGTGWQREEYDAEGLRFEDRGRLLTDTLRALKMLWRDTPAKFDSPTLSFEDVYCEPKPLQPGGVPLWIAGTLHARNLERLVDVGDGWIPIMGETIEGIAAGVEMIRNRWRDAGRDPSALKVQATIPLVMGDDGRPDMGRSMENVPALVAAGATDVTTPLRAFARDPDEASVVMRALAESFRAVL
jgi:probable F420-dependent oxidoreductase